MKTIQQISQYAEVVEASLMLDVPTDEISLIPLITGDSLDSEELCVIYRDYLFFVQECDYRKQKEPSFKDWLIDSQFDGLSRAMGIAERKRLIGLGIEL